MKPALPSPLEVVSFATGERQLLDRHGREVALVNRAESKAPRLACPEVDEKTGWFAGAEAMRAALRWIRGEDLPESPLAALLEVRSIAEEALRLAGDEDPALPAGRPVPTR